MFWRIVDRGLSVIAVLISLLSLHNSSRQLPEDRAVLRLERPAVVFFSPSPGRMVATPIMVLKNDGTSRADRVAMEIQHWPLAWSGVLPAGQRFSLDPGEAKSTWARMDTVNDVNGTVANGTHLYFAVRATWVTAATRRSGCAVYYIDVHEAPGMNTGDRLRLFDVLSTRPSELTAPAIANCPG